MSKVEIKLNHDAIGAFLKSTEMANCIEGFARKVQQNAGGDYAIRTHTTNERVITNVYPASKEAARDNLQNNTLLKALH